MAWGSLSSAHEILVLLALKGGPEYAAQMEAATLQTGRLGKAIITTSAEMQVLNKRTWVHNQLLFTARRLAFYTTLAFITAGVAIAKWGFDYLSAMQQTKVALKYAFPSARALNREMGELYRLSTLSPFILKDVTTAFRTMYPAMKSAGFGAQFVNRTMRDAMDALAVAGRATPGNLNRMAVQLQHMANIGRPTGQVLLALARDGLPVYPALRKELGLTGKSLADMAHSGITARQAIMALNKFIETNKIFSKAAFRLANQTLQGSWQQFRDILSQAAGRGEAGIFGGIHKVLYDINKQLAPLVMHNRPVGMYDVAQAMDHALSPNTHIVINLFITLRTLLKTIIVIFGTLLWVIQKLLRPFDFLASIFGANIVAAKLFGFWLGILTSLFIIQRTAIISVAIAQDLWNYNIKAAELFSVAYARTLRGVVIGLAALNITFEASIALLITWAAVILSVVAVLAILYIKWKAFHDLVNSQQARRKAFSSSQFYGGWWDPVSWLAYPLTKIPGKQHGGISMGGPTLVGERGPEVLNLRGGTSVTPLTSRMLSGAGSLAIHVHPQDIYLDGKKVATVVADAVTGKQARM